MIHEVTLSNGKIVMLEEGEDELHICSEDCGDTGYYICTINVNGVQVLSNSFDAPAQLCEGLVAEDYEEDDEA